MCDSMALVLPARNRAGQSPKNAASYRVAIGLLNGRRQHHAAAGR